MRDSLQQRKFRPIVVIELARTGVTNVNDQVVRNECDPEGEAMSEAAVKPVCQTCFDPPLDSPQWYAVMTRPRHEKRVAQELSLNGSALPFLPLMKEMRRWSDRRKLVEFPLFPGYVFVSLVPTASNKVSVLKLNGVLQFVGAHGHGTAISDAEIDSVRAILSTDLPITPTGYLRVGQRVRIRGGALDGVEGTLAECGRRLIVSINAIQRSLAVALEGFSVEPV